MPITAILGAFWGDEGKGKVASYLSRNASICARFQGGPNAAHTVFFNDNEVSFRMIPAGILFAQHGVIGTGVVINLKMLMSEYERLGEIAPFTLSRLRISLRSHVILPTHLKSDMMDDSLRVGTTKMGIGPVYADKARRTGIRVSDILKDNPQHDVSSCQVTSALFEEFRKKLGQYCIDTEVLLRECLDKEGDVIAEGAQGCLLDIDHGDYPFVTSSNTTIGAVLTGLGVGVRDVKDVFIVASAYMTKVGSGHFPSKIDSDILLHLQIKGKELDGATNQLRDCGWLSLSALRKACSINQSTGVIITKLDVLSGLETLCVIDESGRRIEMQGWEQDISTIRLYDNLPLPAKKYIDFIEDDLQVPIIAVTNGPEDAHFLWRRKLN